MIIVQRIEPWSEFAHPAGGVSLERRGHANASSGPASSFMLRFALYFRAFPYLESMSERWPSPSYELRVEFRAPLEFVYAWCTDFRSDDARAEGESYLRRVLRRSLQAVVFEDLYDTPEGWRWSRHVVRLDPPGHWHSDTVGSHRAYSLDYRLTRLPGDRTRLVLRARRRPYGIGGKNPPKADWERETAKSWKNLGRALERDYRKRHSPHRRR